MHTSSILKLFHKPSLESLKVCNPLSAEIPPTVYLEVIEADPGVKGNTATNALKNAIVETGARVLVPLFIEAGDKIKVNTEDGTYLERVK